MDDKDKLIKLIETKMKTVMVGSLFALEDELGELFGLNRQDLTDSELVYIEKYNNIRKRIFDNGNNQINAMKDLLKSYQIKSTKITLPVIGYKDGKNRI